MRYLLFSMAIVLVVGCGKDEKTPCDKLIDIWKEICAIPDGLEYPCFPCSCALCGRHWVIPDRLGLPDILNSSCKDMGSCEGATRAFAETCLEHAPEDVKQQIVGGEWTDNFCDPRFAYDIWMCDSSANYNLALPEVVEKGRATYDCGE